MLNHLTWALPLASSTLVAGAPGNKPYLGYNSYNDVGCRPNSTWMESTIVAMADNGLRDAGYVYFQPDCGWQALERAPNGSITYEVERFPDGIKPVSDLARANGLKFSMYTNQGVFTCNGDGLNRTGSLGYEQMDAAMFAYWNAEYMKVDNCYITPGENAPKDPREDFPDRFAVMTEALAAVGINDLLICQWGTPYINTTGEMNTLEGPDEWTPPISTAFRVSDDIADGWPNVERIFNQQIHVALRGSSGPSNWSDMDMLEVGNPGLGVTEQRSHFALWAMSKSSLWIGTNVPDMTDETFEILTNEGLLAINQDDLGVPIKLVQRYSNAYDLYAGPLTDDDQAVFLIDTSNASSTLSVDFARLGISCADVKNLWTGETQTATSSYSAEVDAHGSLPLRLTDVQYDDSLAASPQLGYHDFASGSLVGAATTAPCRGCASGEKVGGLVASSSVTLSNIRTSATRQNVRFDYINADVGYLADQKPNQRTAAIRVNGGEPQLVNFPLTGYAWGLDVLEGFLVELDGFNAGEGNEIEVSGPPEGSVGPDNGFAPDFSRVGVVVEG